MISNGIQTMEFVKKDLEKGHRGTARSVDGDAGDFRKGFLLTNKTLFTSRLEAMAMSGRTDKSGIL